MYPGGAPTRRETVCRSWYSLMSSRTMARSSSNMNSASARASSVLPTPVGPRKTNEPIGRFGILQPGAGAAQRVGDRGDRLVLADDALVEPLLHVDQLLGLAFEQPIDRDAGPARDDGRDVVLVDLFLHHRVLRRAALGKLRSSSGISP